MSSSGTPSNSTAAPRDLYREDPGLRGLIRVSPDGHWMWLGELDGDGYGVLDRDGYRWRAHRWTYSLLVRLVDPELTIDHVCRVRRCVNPDHLEEVSQGENNRRIPTWGGNATHCAQGHRFTKENTIPRSDGKRRCRKCKNKQERERRARRAAGNP